MNSKYILNLTSKEMKELGFRYDFFLREYVYEFPVFKHNGKTVLICKIWVNDETFEITTNVYNENGKPYPSYYNRKYIKSKVVEIIDKNIERELRKLGAKERKE